MNVICFKGRQFDADDNFREITIDDWEYLMLKNKNGGATSFTTAHYVRLNRKLKIAEQCNKNTGEMQTINYAPFSNLDEKFVVIVSKERALDELVPF